MTRAASSDTTIWRLIDGQPGHESQSLGLSRALQRIRPCQVLDIRVSGKLTPFANWVSGIWPPGADFPRPDLIIGAGHGTHLPMLAAKRAYGGKTIVMMQPSLPIRCFDLCLIPEHDAYRGGGKYLETRGVLNPLHAMGPHHVDQSLIMLGGPSRHCGWDNPTLITRLRKLLEDNPAVHYTLTTSRRTPKDTLEATRGLEAANLKVVPFEDTSEGWVPEQLARVGSAWISEDSVTMVYEALTARVAVGTLPVPVKRPNRVSNGLEKLLNDRLIVRFDENKAYQRSLRPINGFIEADRCAEWINANWLTQRAPGRAAVAGI